MVLAVLPSEYNKMLAYHRTSYRDIFLCMIRTPLTATCRQAQTPTLILTIFDILVHAAGI